MDRSFDEIKSLLRAEINAGALPSQPTPFWIRDVFADRLIYEEEATSSLYQRPYTIDAAGTVTLGDAQKVVISREYRLVPMSLAGFTETRVGDAVEFTGKIYELGDYPDKAFSLNTIEADEAISAFTPVPNELEHLTTDGQPTVLDNKLGQLARIWRNGAELFGTFTMPLALRTLLGDRVKVSLVWQREPKRILRCGLVVNPRVPDAEIVAAFARKGAVMDKPTWSERLQAWFGKAQKAVPFDDEDPNAAPSPLLPFSRGDDPRIVQMQAEIAAMRNERVSAENARLEELAAAFANDAVKARKVLPSESGWYTTLFIDAARDDAREAARSAFSAEGKLVEGRRLTALRQAVADRPSLDHLTTELIRSGEVRVLFDGPSTPPAVPTQAREDELLAMTAAGRDVIAQRQHGGR